MNPMFLGAMLVPRRTKTDKGICKTKPAYAASDFKPCMVRKSPDIVVIGVQNRGRIAADTYWVDNRLVITIVVVTTIVAI